MFLLGGAGFGGRLVKRGVLPLALGGDFLPEIGVVVLPKLGGTSPDCVVGVAIPPLPPKSSPIMLDATKNLRNTDKSSNKSSSSTL